MQFNSDPIKLTISPNLLNSSKSDRFQFNPVQFITVQSDDVRLSLYSLNQFHSTHVSPIPPGLNFSQVKSIHLISILFQFELIQSNSDSIEFNSSPIQLQVNFVQVNSILFGSVQFTSMKTIHFNSFFASRVDSSQVKSIQLKSVEFSAILI